MPTREPLDAIVGLIVGAVLGAFWGFVFWMYLLPGWPLFPGDLLLAGALVCTVLGYLKGDDFFRWVRDHGFH